MNMMPVIASPGPPPERHAARIVVETCRWLHAEELRLGQLTNEQIPRTRMGTPTAQIKFAQRLVKAAGKALVEIKLKPGKRGKFVFADSRLDHLRPGGEPEFP
jgi:hypothetical protein